METPKLPDIKPEINKADEEEDRKSGGFLGSLLSKLGGGAGATGGVGGAGGLAGGLLATKAGIIGLALVGTTVAGTIGLVGYKAFGPGGEDRGDARFQSLFAAKPAAAPAAEGAEGKAADGSSDSLNSLVKANSPSQADIDKAKAEEDAKAKAEAEAKAKADAEAKAKADAEAKSKADAAVAAKKGNDAAPGAKAGKLKADSIGKLAAVPRGGGGGGSTSASMSAASNITASRGKLGGFSAGPRTSGGSVSKGLAGRKAGALAQLSAVRGDQRGATSSYGAGSTYDGSRGGTAITGDAGGAETGAGSAAGKTPTAPGATPAAGDDRFPEPPPASATGANVTPYQAAINTAMMLIAASALLLMLAPKVAKMPSGGVGWAKAMCGLAALLGAWAMAIGISIAGAEYGQVAQGNMIMLAGTAIIATSAVAYMGAESMKTTGEPSMLMYVCGAAALGAMMMAYLTPTTSYPPDYFKDNKPCDMNYGMSMSTCERNTTTTTGTTVPTPVRNN